MSDDQSDGKSPSIPICPCSAVTGMESSFGLQQNLESDRESEANPERQNSFEETINAVSESEDATYFQHVLLKELFYETRGSRMPQAKSVRNQSDDSAASATDASYKQSQEEEEKLPSKFECELYSYLLPYFSSNVGKVKTPCVNLVAKIADSEELVLIFLYKDKKAVKNIVQVYKELLKNLIIREIVFEVKSDRDLFKFVERKNCLRGWGTDNSHVYISTCATEEGKIFVFGFDGKSIDEAEQWIKSHVNDSGITSKALPAFVQQPTNNDKKYKMNPRDEKHQRLELSATSLEIGSTNSSERRGIEAISVAERKSLTEENSEMKRMPDHQIEQDSKVALSITESDLCADDSQEKSDQALLEAAAIVNNHWIKEFGNGVLKRSCDKNHVKIMESQDSSGKTKSILKGTLVDLVAVQKALDKHAKMINSELSNETECAAKSTKSNEVISEQTDVKENLINKKVAENTSKGARRKEYKTFHVDESNQNKLGNLEVCSLPFVKNNEKSSEETVTSEFFEDAVEDLSALGLNEEAVVCAGKPLNSGLGMIGSIASWFSGSQADKQARTLINESSASAAACDQQNKAEVSSNSVSFQVPHYEYLAPFINETLKERNLRRGYSIAAEANNNIITLRFSSKNQNVVKEVIEIHENWRKKIIMESTLIWSLFADQIWCKVDAHLKMVNDENKFDSVSISREIADKDYMRIIVLGVNEQKVKDTIEFFFVLNVRYDNQIFPLDKSAGDQHLAVDNMQPSTCPAMAHTEVKISDLSQNFNAVQIGGLQPGTGASIGFAGPNLSSSGMSAASLAAASSATPDYDAAAAANIGSGSLTDKPRVLDNRPRQCELIIQSVSPKSSSPELYCKTSLLNVNIHVLCDNMIKPMKITDAEVVICPSDRQLSFSGGLSALIIREAGDKIKQICRSHIKQYGDVPVSEFVCTPSGNIARNYNDRLKYILFVSGPTPIYSSGSISNIDELLNQTSDTYINCLWHAEFILRMKRIAFPAIGAGNLSVPIELVVQSFVNAVRKFEEQALQLSPSSNIRDIYFISNEERVAQEMIHRIQVYTKKQ